MPETDPYVPFPSFDNFAAESAFDAEGFDLFAEEFANLKSEVGDHVLRRSIATATRWAAVNTGAIENLYDVDRGFTYTVAASAAAIENIHLEKGQDVQNQVNDALAGYDYVLDVATGRREPSEHWIKELHAVICATQKSHRVLTDAGWQEQDLPKGEYKSQPNNPMNLTSGRVHEYAPPADTGPEMARLVAELQSEVFNEAHPVLQAAYVHYAFVCVHPFADGNGRVSRTLASTYLYRAPGIPLVIFADQKGTYIDALEAADEGALGHFVAFVRDCALDIIGMVGQDMRRPERPSPTERVAELRAALIAPQGLPHTEMDALTVRIESAWREALQEALDERPLEQVTLGLRDGAKGRLNGYREQKAKTTMLAGSSPAPADAQRQDSYVVLIPRAGTSTVDFQILRASGEELMDIALREVHPIVTTAFRYRLRVLAHDEFERHIDALTASALSSLKKKGLTE